jgi:hypothetical protein
MIRNFGATGMTNQPQGLDLGLSGSNIKSIQRGTASVLSTDTAKVVDINAVNRANSIIKFNYIIYAPAQYLCQTEWMVDFSSSTQITFQRTTANGQLEIQWEVIEFNNVKSKQTGWTVSANTTIASVDLNKTTIFAAANNSANVTDLVSQKYSYGLTTATNLHFAFNQANFILYYQIIEFN